MLISIFDTTICDNNLGNQIIVDSIKKHLYEMFPDAFFVSLPYLEGINKQSLYYIRKSDYVFFAGTNALSSRMEIYKQWGINMFNASLINNVILMGLGWWQYQEGTSFYTKYLLKKVLHKKISHSVRDSYTERKLIDIDIKNVINTTCPTLWDLTPDLCSAIPTTKAKNVLLTFTNYNQKLNLDRKIFDVLQNNYERIFLWVQGPEDLEYAKKIGGNEIEFIKPRLESLDELLSSDIDLDYVGTRLHAGIRAMQFKRRSLIISIDNRAAEIAKDTNINIISRDDLGGLANKINGPLITNLSIPFDQIRNWKNQFPK